MEVLCVDPEALVEEVCVLMQTGSYHEAGSALASNDNLLCIICCFDGFEHGRVTRVTKTKNPTPHEQPDRFGRIGPNEA